MQLWYGPQPMPEESEDDEVLVSEGELEGVDESASGS